MGVPVQVGECRCVNVSVRTHIYIRSVRTCLWDLPDGTKTASVDEPMWMAMRHVCGPDGESGMRTRSTVLRCVMMVNTMWSRWKIRMWLTLEIRKWQLRGSGFFFGGTRGLDLWLMDLRSF